jgi:hypothetical protein
MRRWIGLCALASSVALAIVIGQRMDAEALAVVVGVVAGVVAGLPTAFLVLLATSRREDKHQPTPYPSATHPPPMVVIQGGTQPSLPQPRNPAWNMPRERPFVVVGQEDEWAEDGQGWG